VGPATRRTVDKTEGATGPLALVGIVVYGDPRDQHSTAHELLPDPCKKSINEVAGLALPTHPRLAQFGVQPFAQLELGH